MIRKEMFLKDFQKKSFLIKSLLIVISSTFFLSSVCSQKLPFKSYTTADGSAHNHIARIYQDKKGFLWFGTWEGLSRFDGYEFVNYDVQDGLASHIVNDMTEDKFGRFWVATNDNGISLLIDKNFPNQNGNENGKKFTSFLVGASERSNKVNRIFVEKKDNIWCLTDDGVYRAPVSDNPVFTLVQPQPSKYEEFTSRLLFKV